MQDIKTRFFILADTHAKSQWWSPLDLPVDVAIHCGGLTHESKMYEFRDSLALLRAINAPLKLVIAGNHDFTLDNAAYQQKVAEANRLFSIEPEAISREYGRHGDARKLLDDDDGIIFLDEGIHHFDLRNGAHLTVYASPFTPSPEADWGFQYRHGEQHDFSICNADLVITHGPPKGVLDQTIDKRRGGCEQIFAAVARSRPRLHCFGHIHEGESPSHFTDIDNGASSVVKTLATMWPGKWDDAETAREKEALAARWMEQGYRQTSHCAGDRHPVNPGQATLFVNAAVQPACEEDRPQLPWVVDIELPRRPTQAEV
ncbi:Metallo-dependent phosphatase-like protein [Chaetomium sp. MPI-CAGE-AT-0009]|nr:Metallo-dependent phosphatase-like protein [Chaetomium sp. MPI-CAGE-AT-0009]